MRSTLRARPQPARTTRLRAARLRGEEGMSTAEYAVGTVAACGFAGLLYKILTSDEVLGLLTDVVRRAITAVF